jgi:hypothetical protein
MQFHVAAIGTFERPGDFAFVRQPASVAKWRLDEPNARPALAADESLFWQSTRGFADLANAGIEPRQARFDTMIDWRGEHGARYETGCCRLQVESCLLSPCAATFSEPNLQLDTKQSGDFDGFLINDFCVRPV